MKFGLSFLPDASPMTKSSIDYFKDILELSVIADRAGLSAIKMTEHYLHPYGGYCPSPLIFLSAVASITRQIRLMTGCILPVFHHPLQIASEVAMLDSMSHGRVDVGFARAYLPYEFDAFQVDMDSSRDRYTQTILSVIKLWNEKKVSISNNFFAFDNVNSMPEPVQKPHPPIWGAAVNSRQSFAWLAEQGFNLLVSPPTGPLHKLQEGLDIYRESYKSAKDFPQQPEIALSLPLIIHKNHQTAIKLSDGILGNYLDVWSDAADCWSNRTSSDYPKYTGLASILNSNSPSSMREHTQALVGCPEAICEGIRRIQDTLKINYILLQIDTGSQSGQISKNTLDLFINKVLPSFHRQRNHEESHTH